jgi:hypothetical protein
VVDSVAAVRQAGQVVQGVGLEQQEVRQHILLLLELQTKVLQAVKILVLQIMVQAVVAALVA